MFELQKLVAMLFLKAAPQDMSYRPSQAVRLAVAYWFSGVLVLETSLQPSDILASMMLSLVVLVIYTWGLLRAFGLQNRFIQTVSAIVGVGMLFNLLSWPVLLMLSVDDSGENALPVLSLVFLMLISWEVLVKAYIFKNAIDVSMFNALLLSFALFFIAMTLSQLLFPGNQGS